MGKSANERQRKRKRERERERERERAKGRERVVDGKRVHDWVEELVLPSRLPCLGSRFVLLRPSKVGGNLRVLSVKRNRAVEEAEKRGEIEPRSSQT